MPSDEMVLLREAGMPELLAELTRRFRPFEPDLGGFKEADLTRATEMLLARFKESYSEDNNIPAFGQGDPTPAQLAYGKLTTAQVPELRDDQQGVALLFSSKKLRAAGQGEYELTTYSFKELYKPRYKHAFAQERTIPGACTGFLGSRQRILTTAHGYDLCQPDCALLDVLEMPSEGPLRVRAGELRWFDGAPTRDDANDCVCIPLRDPVEAGRIVRPLLRTPIADKRAVHLIGHPWGLALKIAANARVLANGDAATFNASIDAYRGHSGAPIFDAQSHEVVGMVRGGPKDLVVDELNSIMTMCILGACVGETCVRSSVFAALLP